MNEGSLSLCIVALEKRGTHPRDPRSSQGESFMVRYADDFVMGFANKSDAESMLEAPPHVTKRTTGTD